MNITHKYDDIIHLARPKSEKRARMGMVDRAAQFSPFAALVGYDAAIAETARLTDFRMELTESAKASLNEQLQRIAQSAQNNPKVRVTYFLPDERKSGGSYVRCIGRVKRVDGYRDCLVLLEGLEIPFHDIYELETVSNCGSAEI